MNHNNTYDENDILDGKWGRNTPTLGGAMTLKVESSKTIYDIVTMIKDKLRIPQYCRHMLLVHGEEVVNEKSSLNDYHIEMGSTQFFVAPMQEILAKGGRKELEDDFTLADYYIHNESTLLARRSEKYIMAGAPPLLYQRPRER
ncbi:zinc finger, CCHC-type containing protein [Tanacetum coccineum]